MARVGTFQSGVVQTTLFPLENPVTGKRKQRQIGMETTSQALLRAAGLSPCQFSIVPPMMFTKRDSMKITVSSRPGL